MSGRSWYPNLQATSAGLVICAFSFKTNDTSDPDTDDFRGCGGETGSDGAGSVSNSGPSAVRSILYSAVGVYDVILADGYRFVQCAHLSIDDAADALMPRITAPAAEGGGQSTPVTFSIKVRDLSGGTGTLTESTGRRISCTLILKNSGSGA